MLRTVDAYSRMADLFLALKAEGYSEDQIASALTRAAIEANVKISKIMRAYFEDARKP